jgi:hypothetical protein
MPASSASDALLGRFPNASLGRRVADGRFAFCHERVRVYGTPGRRFGCCLRLLSKRVRAYLRQQREILVTVSELPLRVQGRSQGWSLSISSILAFQGVRLVARTREALGQCSMELSNGVAWSPVG